MNTTPRGWVILDGKPYLIAELQDSDCYEAGTRFVSLSLVELEERVLDETEERFGW